MLIQNATSGKSVKRDSAKSYWTLRIRVNAYRAWIWIIQVVFRLEQTIITKGKKIYGPENTSRE
jgi:hypothetical protein